MKDFLEFILKGIVQKPDAIKVEESEDEEGKITLMIRADEQDIGRIIGKQGKIIKSIRNLVRVRAIKEKKIVFVQI